MGRAKILVTEDLPNHPDQIVIQIEGQQKHREIDFKMSDGSSQLACLNLVFSGDSIESSKSGYKAVEKSTSKTRTSRGVKKIYPHTYPRKLSQSIADVFKKNQRFDARKNSIFELAEIYSTPMAHDRRISETSNKSKKGSQTSISEASTDFNRSGPIVRATSKNATSNIDKSKSASMNQILDTSNDFYRTARTRQSFRSARKNGTSTPAMPINSSKRNLSLFKSGARTRTSFRSAMDEKKTGVSTTQSSESQVSNLGACNVRLRETPNAIKASPIGHEGSGNESNLYGTTPRYSSSGLTDPPTHISDYSTEAEFSNLNASSIATAKENDIFTSLGAPISSYTALETEPDQAKFEIANRSRTSTPEKNVTPPPVKFNEDKPIDQSFAAGIQTAREEEDEKTQVSNATKSDTSLPMHNSLNVINLLDLVNKSSAQHSTISAEQSFDLTRGSKKAHIHEKTLRFGATLDQKHSIAVNLRVTVRSNEPTLDFRPAFIQADGVNIWTNPELNMNN